MSDPGRQRVVEGEVELLLLARHGQPFQNADLAVDARQPAAAVLDAPADHLEGERFPRIDVQPEQSGVEVRAERVDVVDQQVLQSRPLGEEIAENAVAEQVRHLVPVADRVEALQRFVVGVVGPLPGGLCPADERGLDTFADLLLLLVEHLVRGLLPSEAQVADHRHQPQPHRHSWRGQHRTGIAVGAVLLEVAADRVVREVAGGEDVRDCDTESVRGSAALGEVDFEEACGAGRRAGRTGAAP